jgi:hypothetical protein
MLSAVLLFICCATTTVAFNAANYANSREVIATKYWLYWNVDVPNGEVSFAVRVSTRGWIGLGISESGGMIGSDVAVGWINTTGSPVLTDRFVFEHAEPVIDSHQDWVLISGEETVSPAQTILEFKRKFKTCDKATDMDIKEGRTRVIFAYSDTKPLDNVHMGLKHTAKGSTTITFYGVPDQPIPVEPTSSFDILAPDILIPSDPTTYYCTPVALPVTADAHIVKYETILDNVPRVHHFLVYDCASQPNMTHGPCETLGPHDCHLLSYGWAVGGGDFVLPRDLGVPFGPNSTQWVLLQTHYDNPEQLSGQRDSSGVRITYTTQLRRYDVGMFMTGRTEPGIAIPPANPAFEVIGDCIADCTRQLLPPEGINVFSVNLHSHLLGRKMWTQLIRNGTEMEPIAYRGHYDFNFQDYTLFTVPLKLYPGDRIITHCVYDSTGRTVMTPGGLGTRQEMCYTFMSYYPKLPRNLCVDVTNPAETQKAVWCTDHAIPKPTPVAFVPLPPDNRVCPSEQTETEDNGSNRVTSLIAVFAVCLFFIL